jgi:hypothetical protein
MKRMFHEVRSVREEPVFARRGCKAELDLASGLTVAVESKPMMILRLLPRSVVHCGSDQGKELEEQVEFDGSFH